MSQNANDLAEKMEQLELVEPKLDKLPKELLLLIFKHAGRYGRTIGHLKRTCRLFYNLISDQVLAANNCLFKFFWLKLVKLETCWPCVLCFLVWLFNQKSVVAFKNYTFQILESFVSEWAAQGCH